MSRRKFDDDSWYVNLIMGFVVLITAVFLNLSYDSYLTQDAGSVSGKGGKIGLLVVKLFDKLGGRPMVFGIHFVLAMLCFWWAYRKYKKNNH